MKKHRCGPQGEDLHSSALNILNRERSLKITRKNISGDAWELLKKRGG